MQPNPSLPSVRGRRLSRPLLISLVLYVLVGSVALASFVASPGRTRREAAAAAAEHAPDKCPVPKQTSGKVMLASNAQEAQPKPDMMMEEEIPESGDSKGCVSCHAGTEPSHSFDVGATCVGCHGGDGAAEDKDKAHVQPRFPKAWGKDHSTPFSGNPERTYTLLNEERPEFIRFVNPGDLRVAHLSCGPCHEEEVLNVRKSMMTHGAFLLGSAVYNNGAFPLKNPHFGESYSMNGVPQRVNTVPQPTPEETRLKGIIPFIDPLPRWEISQVGNIFRAFERGGLKKGEVGNPLRDEEPGRPDIKLSTRGHGTQLRTDPTVLGAQKTRLFDPTLNFMGTNDQPGDFHSSGCTGCHNVYANDRDPKHSAQYAKYGHWGESATKDPMLAEAIEKKERGHPVSHQMTNGMPSSQCMSCHIHPGTNMVASYLGYTWWDNETDGDLMYPKKPLKLSDPERKRIMLRNPEGAALKGLWSDVNFLANVTDLNPKLKRTQFGDFHSHGWIFRKVYKQDRKGNLLDKDGNRVSFEDPEKFQKALHLTDIHLEKGMHCVDCHFKQDNHGNGKLYQEPRAAIEIDCIDCHGSVRKRADLLSPDAVTTGPAGGNKLSDYNEVKRGADTVERWYRKDDGRIFQRSAVEPDKEWEVPQILDTITPGHPRYNEKSRLAKTIRKDGRTWGNVPATEQELAHSNDTMTCFACHTSWTTACFGCHLNMQANRKMPQLHNEGGNTRNYTQYNFQTLRDDLYMLGKDGTVTKNRVAPIRSSCAVLVSSQNQNREWIYYQQQTVSSEGLSGTAFSSYVPHTVRGKETKQCSDCHVSDKGDNNAWLANLLLQGTNATNFIGQYAYVANEHGFQAVRVAERDEPAAVIGSYLHKLAYPDKHARHVREGRRLGTSWNHHGHTLDLQLRGEYLYAAEGEGGLVIYDVANVDNKGFSERTVTAPVSPLGQKLYIGSRYATAVAAPSTMLIDPARTQLPVNEESTIHPLYGYIYFTDKYEGLIVVPAGTLFDGNPTNNFLKRAVTWNPGGILAGARSIEIAGTHAYVTCDRGLVIVNISDPLKPQVAAEIGGPALNQPRSVAVQFRYAFVADADGLKVLDVTTPSKARVVPGATVKLGDANHVYVSRTYAYVAAGHDGLAIIDVERPEQPKLEQLYNADGQLNDAHAVRVAMTNNSMYAYVADGKNGLRVVQLTSPEATPGIFGYSPSPTPQLIATFKTAGPAIAVSEGLDRDRAVDESGNQLSVFGRRGARPFNLAEQQQLYLRNGGVYKVSDLPPSPAQEMTPAAARLPRDERLGWAAMALVIPLGMRFALRRRKRRET